MKSRSSCDESDQLSRDIASLSALSVKHLKDRWRSLYGTETVLIREWQGTSHRVTVLDDGSIYRGQRYQSLSEVARVITGTRWSGPLFFGLRGRAKEAGNA